MASQTFTVTADTAGRGRVLIPLPFDPGAVWGAKPRHHVHGTVAGFGVRAVVEPAGDGYGIILGPAWLRCCAVAAGDTVTVEIAPEGPQRGELAEDIAEALNAHPEAAAFFDSLAQFYRRAYLRWVDATTRRPDLRAERIAELIRLLAAGHKQRPRS